jgi:hypothetical protein
MGPGTAAVSRVSEPETRFGQDLQADDGNITRFEAIRSEAGAA